MPRSQFPVDTVRELYNRLSDIVLGEGPTTADHKIRVVVDGEGYTIADVEDQPGDNPILIHLKTTTDDE